MAADPVYLDHNATTPIARQVAEAMWPHLTEDFGNPSSASVQGRRARAALDRAREQVAALVCAHPDEIVFPSGRTEAHNLAIPGAARHLATRVAVTSCVEHPATAAPLAHLREHRGWRVHELPVDDECRVVLDEMPSAAVGLGTLILAHNETGAIQPGPELAERVQGGVQVGAHLLEPPGRIEEEHVEGNERVAHPEGLLPSRLARPLEQHAPVRRQRFAVHQALLALRLFVGDLEDDDPTFTERIVVDQFRARFEFTIDLDDVPCERGKKIRHTLRGLDLAERLARLGLGPNLW